jgi:hypothetical protein
MKLDQNIVSELSAIAWLSKCGQIAPPFSFSVTQVTNWKEARKSCKSGWLDATERAQGDLSEYLALKHPEAYQKYWNQFADECRPLVRATAGASVSSFAEESNLKLEDIVNWDILCAVMESSFASLKPPVFFSRLFEVYRAGHFPCGQKSDGSMVVF